MKIILWSLFVTYLMLFAGDYVGMSRIANEERCKVILSWPWYGHLLMPGAGNACLDLGLGFNK